MRIVICGGPRTGKTTRAEELRAPEGLPVMHTDDLIDQPLSWSEQSQLIADHWLQMDGPWIIEGTTAVRALRKRLEADPDHAPCDRVVFLDQPVCGRTPKQAALGKGIANQWRKICARLVALGVEVEYE